MKHLINIFVAVIVLIVSTFWFAREFEFEALITMISCIGFILVASVKTETQE